MGTPAVDVTGGITVGLVVMPLAIDEGADMGAKIVSTVGEIRFIIYSPEDIEHWQHSVFVRQERSVSQEDRSVL